MTKPYNPKSPKLHTETLQNAQGRTANRARLDQMQRWQKKARALTKVAVSALIDGDAPAEAKAAAHVFLYAHRNRVTAMERTLGRAMERDIVREERRVNRGQVKATPAKVATVAPPQMPTCAYQRKLLNIK